MPDLDALKSFCARIEREGADRVVVRWIDEKRPVQEREGVTIRSVTEATLKAGVEGRVVTETFEEIPYPKLRSLLEPYEFEVLYRSDNLTR